VSGGADDYQISTVVEPPDLLRETWRVRGPAKRYDATTTLRRVRLKSWHRPTEYRSTRLSDTDSGPAYPPTAVQAVADVQATPKRELLVSEGFTVD